MIYRPKPASRAAGWRVLPAALCALLLSACSFAPPYERPTFDLPASSADVMVEAVEARWWQRFGDAWLNDLVEEALRYNQDILAAQARLEQADAFVRQSAGGLFPSPSLNAERGEQRLSSQTIGGPPPEANRVRNRSAGLRVSWELDFWGKARNAYRGALASRQASAADRDALALLVAGNVVKAYAALLSARQQARIAEETVVQREQAERLQRNAVEVGGNDEVEWLRVRGELSRARHSLEMAELRRERAAQALSLLLGRSPARIMADDALLALEFPAGDALRANPVPEALPFRLLEQRPDLKAAEYALMAEHFNIGVIRAHYLPSIGIDAAIGTAAASSADLGRANAATWSILGVLNLPLDFWNTHFREEMSEARRRELTHAYEKAVRNAFGDVRDALFAIRRLDGAGETLAQMEAALSRAATIAGNRYRYGYANYMDVLDAGRALLDARLDLAEHRNTRIAAEVDLVMALGGGWDGHREEGPETRPDAP
jgi:multidrug efflux system outer membrane protein